MPLSAAATSAFQLEHMSRLLRSVCPGGYWIRTIIIRESVDSLRRDGTDAQYMQYCRFRFVLNSRASVIRDSIRKLCNRRLCSCCVFPAYGYAQQMKVFVFVLVCHGGNMDCWRTQYTTECGSKAYASRVFINSRNEHAHLTELSQLPSQLAFIAARLT